MYKYFVIGVFSILFATVASFNFQTAAINGTGRSDSESTETFQKIGSNFYLIESNFRRTWQDSVHYCRTQGAHLASIETESEWEPLNSYFMSQELIGMHQTWIGANDIDTPYEFFWISTGEPMLFTKWSPNEPNNVDDVERCVHIVFKGSGFEMNDLNCKRKLFYICKF